MRWNLFVIDDSHRFVLHAWRYLSQNIGIGVDEQSNWIARGKEILTDCGGGSLRWIPADDCWRHLQNILQSGDGQGSNFFIVDADRGVGRESPEEITGRLKEAFRGAGRECAKIFFVSAHSTGHRDRTPVYPKTRRTFRLLRKELEIRAHRETFAEPEDTHILVTGAGFEIRDENGSFGLPPTPELLYNMGYPFTRGPSAGKGFIRLKNDLTYPVPRFGLWKYAKRREALRKIKEAAKKGDLDQYWNHLLYTFMDDMLCNLATKQGEERDKAMTESIWNERLIREAFRQSLLKYDWGHMKQSIYAARMPWHAWLTTNYTHFANRAIDLVGAARSGENGSRRPWRIIATASEARSAEQALVASRNRDRRPARHLFKLHGDLADLHTMAIAGFDKDIFSPLGIKVESLGQIYTNAENFLRRSVPPPPARLVWHIVGHSLNDVRLSQLIAGVSGVVPTGGQRLNLFILVSPGSSTNLPEPRLKLLREIRSAPGQEVRRVKSTALRYMAQLSLEPMPSFEELLRRFPP